MQESLLSFIENKKQEGNLNKQSEEATKQGLILPMLHHLGWNPFNVQEVYPEYSVQNGRVDYSLRLNTYNKVFIEVKKVGEDLEKHQEQLLRYAFQHGVKLAVLTNGIIWWFYLPLHEGSWEQRRFYTIDLQSQSTPDIVSKFTSFLSRNDVSSGQAITNAENIYNSRQKGEIIRHTLPKAWQKLLRENDDLLGELMAETVEKLCGYKPDIETVILFLKQISGESNLKSIPRSSVDKHTPNSISTSDTSNVNQDDDSVSNSLLISDKPTSFSFDGKEYKVDSWITLLRTFVNTITEKHPDNVNKLTSLVGKRRPYFSTDNNLLRKGCLVPNTSLHYETHFSASSIVRFVGKILRVMGYPANAVTIKTLADQNVS